jgi:adenylate kinase
MNDKDVANGFILDGFPRTFEQGKALDALLQELGQPLDAILYLAAPNEVVVARLSNRMECPVCHRAYNRVEMKPRVEGQCDADGTRLIGRADDDDTSVRHRIEVYFDVTAVLIDYYRDSGRLIEIDANQSPDAVFEGIKIELKRLRESDDDDAGAAFAGEGAVDGGGGE